MYYLSSCLMFISLHFLPHFETDVWQPLAIYMAEGEQFRKDCPGPSVYLRHSPVFYIWGAGLDVMTSNNSSQAFFSLLEIFYHINSIGNLCLTGNQKMIDSQRKTNNC